MALVINFEPYNFFIFSLNSFNSFISSLLAAYITVCKEVFNSGGHVVFVTILVNFSFMSYNIIFTIL